MARHVLLGLIALAMPGTAFSQSTTTYQYDALGRLVVSTVSGGPVPGVQTTITYDAAGNRKNYQVTGAPTGSGGDGNGGASVPPAQMLLVVVPLNGYTVIPITQ